MTNQAEYIRVEQQFPELWKEWEMGKCRVYTDPHPYQMREASERERRVFQRHRKEGEAWFLSALVHEHYAA